MPAPRGAAVGQRMEGLSPSDYLDDPLTAHPRYRKIRDLNEGTFGVVVLAQDVRIKEPVRPAGCVCQRVSDPVAAPWCPSAVPVGGDAIHSCSVGGEALTLALVLLGHLMLRERAECGLFVCEDTLSVVL